MAGAIIVPHLDDNVIEASKGSMPLAAEIVDNMEMSVGDIDNDGVFDLIIPYPHINNGSGTLMVYPSSSTSGPISLYSNTSGARFGELVIADNDIDGDGTEDILVLDGYGTVHAYLGRPEWADLSWNSSDATIKNCTELTSFDINGDDKDDLIVYYNGTLRVHFGPDLFTSRSVPLDGDIVQLTGGDMNGDGVLELIVLESDPSGTMITFYDNITLMPSKESHFNVNISSIKAGDLNGDGKYDLILHMPDSSPDGQLSSFFSPISEGELQPTSYRFSIIGSPQETLVEGFNWLLDDIDGDRCDDIVISFPEYDGGRGKLAAFFSPSDDVGQIYLNGADSYVTGHTDDHMGRLLLSTGDMDNDHLPEVFVSSGFDLYDMNLTFNNIPGPVREIGAFARESPHGDVYIQDGEQLHVWMKCEDRSPSTKDLSLLELKNGDVRTNLLMEETSTSSGLFLGEITVGNGTLYLSSIMASPGDILLFHIDEMELSIPVYGKIWEDDSPLFIGLPEGELEIHVEEELDMNIFGLDPDGNDTTIEAKKLPRWIELNGRTLTGTPSVEDVGENEISLSISDGWTNTTGKISCSVIIPTPKVTLPPGPYEFLEGIDLNFSIDIKNVLADTSYLFNYTGPHEDGWITFSSIGYMIGMPANRDVGRWSFNLTVVNPKNTSASCSWSFSVLNVDPDLVSPGPLHTNIYDDLKVDLSTTFEGDGLTYYSAIGPVGLTISPVSGVITWSPDPTQSGIHAVSVSVFDGHGGSNTTTFEIHVSDIPLELVSPLPEQVYAHENILFHLEAKGKGVINYSLDGLPYWMEHDGATGAISGRPWNMDAGKYLIIVTIRDSTERVLRKQWNLTVHANNTIGDPSLIVVDYDITDEELSVNFTVVNMTGPVDSISLTVTDNSGRSLTINRNDGSPKPLILDLKGFSGPFMAVVEASTEGRYINTTFSISMDENRSQGSSCRWLLLPLIMILLLFILITLITLLSLERTSFHIQNMIIRKNGLKRSDLITIIQHHPGIRYRDISNEVSLTRSEILSSLSYLERSGDIRAIEAGTNIRFYPTVGSFVDGRLLLNSQEIKLVRALLNERSLTEGDLMEETGLNRQRLRKNVSVLDLKGMISFRSKGDVRNYYLSSVQKKRAMAYLRGTDQ